MITLTLSWLFWTILAVVVAIFGISFVKDGNAKKILYGALLIALALWLLQSFGIISPIINFRIK
jgi:hypothetical protein